MKIIHAYVRHSQAEHVIAALAEAGCRTLSVLEVRGITHDVPPDRLDVAVDLAQRFEHMVKLEIVCDDDAALEWSGTIVNAARTNRPGDGLVAILPVEHLQPVRDMPGTSLE